MDVSGTKKVGNRARVRGFTLLEIMITVTIISVMTAVSLVSLSNLKMKQQVSGDARSLASAIRSAQNFALTGRNILGVGFIPCAFKVSASGSSFTLQQSNSTDCVNFQGNAYSLSSGVSFSSAQEISFNVPQAEPRDENGKELGESGARALVDFTLSKGGNTAHVCVYPLGRIEDNLPAC
ncbi:MAG: prepilin-type N-terminal cleavage/methylation domain-containing protein [Candidatus Moranbacteria bacterium]|nr:prepilin-type N-terminal cleavage/methylation domain-containing protein [Candidatus Moranbacteria bacterium]